MWPHNHLVSLTKFHLVDMAPMLLYSSPFGRLVWAMVPRYLRELILVEKKCSAVPQVGDPCHRVRDDRDEGAGAAAVRMQL
jgi:hypothetical protein